MVKSRRVYHPLPLGQLPDEIPCARVEVEVHEPIALRQPQLFPKDLPLGDEPLIGAEAVYRVLKGWVGHQ
jgi:hypothetical protein